MKRVSRAHAKVAVVSCGLLLAIVGCSSTEESTRDCLGETAAPLRTCAKGATLDGIDVSYYQGTINWASVKAAGKTFAFARVSDGLSYPDNKFASNWPAMKSAGIVRGAYQYFRPSADANAQADLMLDKIKAAGGLQPGDLPPVLDLETDSGLAASVVVARAKTWLAKVEAQTGVKPIVYTAAFMSNVIGTSFSGYTLWVANYGATCPLMPSGWTDWKFWQTSDSGKVNGIGGNVDTNVFNGAMSDLLGLTLKPAKNDPPSKGTSPAEPAAFVAVDDAVPNDGSQGATIGGTPPPKEPAGATITPCL
jgi:lysozyme